MLNHKIKITVGVVCICTAISAHALTEIEMANGDKATTCATYNSLRATQRVSEKTWNQIYRSEYLDCANDVFGGGPMLPGNNVSAIANALRVRQFASGLAQQIDSPTDTFAKMGATYNAADHSLNYVDDAHELRIFFERQKTVENGTEYLVHYVETIHKGSYRAYYPAIVTDTGSGVTVRPFYASGF